MLARTLDVSTNCNLCGSSSCTVLYGAGVAQLNQIVRCDRCGLMYASPRKVADHVEIESWPNDPNWNFARERPQTFEKETLQTRDYAGTRERLNRLYPQRGCLLEVGSSTGSLLQTFRNDGWQVRGVEPDRNAARYATSKLGIETINAILENAEIPNESVDVVVMLHVIEHVPNPVGTLKEIFRILKPGGHLVLETPRYDTLMFKLLGRRERSLSCDGHIFFFTTDSLRKTYEKAGFLQEHFECVGRSLTFDRLAYNLAVISKSPSVKRIVKAISRRLMLQKFQLTINVRDMQRVCVRKPIADVETAA
jgi:2-polyprenyl-3-methyl-5-hydroxy-6-metoxy-1,4-benzoquinol methylase